MITKTITVTAAITRSRDFQTVRYELTEGLEIEPGDDRDEVIEATRKRLFAEVNDFTDRAISHIAGQSKGAK
ncbi:MAG: hypothetical protein ACRYFS_15130 [Janthinobacterium lividum]